MLGTTRCLESSVLLSMRLFQSSRSKVLREKAGQQSSSFSSQPGGFTRGCWDLLGSLGPKSAHSLKQHHPNPTPTEPASVFSCKKQIKYKHPPLFKSANQNMNMFSIRVAAATRTWGHAPKTPCAVSGWGRAKCGTSGRSRHSMQVDSTLLPAQGPWGPQSQPSTP